MKRQSFNAVLIALVHIAVFPSVASAQLSWTHAQIDLKSVDLTLTDLQTDHLIAERPSWVVRESANWSNSLENIETLREEVLALVPSHPKHVIEYRQKFEQALGKSLYRSSWPTPNGLHLSRTD